MKWRESPKWPPKPADQGSAGSTKLKDYLEVPLAALFSVVLVIRQIDLSSRPAPMNNAAEARQTSAKSSAYSVIQGSR